MEQPAIYRASGLQEAVALHLAHPQAVLLAGGTSARAHAAGEQISLEALASLQQISWESRNVLRLGALVTLAQLAADPLLAREVPVLCAAAAAVADSQVRSRATLGGSLCMGSAASNVAPVLLALEALVELTGPDAVRQIPIGEFYEAPGQVALRSGELVTAVLLQPWAHGAFLKYPLRQTRRITTLSCCTLVQQSGDGQSIRQARIAFGGLFPLPFRCLCAEDVLYNQLLSPALPDLLEANLLRDLDPEAQALYGHLAAALAVHCLGQALAPPPATSLEEGACLL